MRMIPAFLMGTVLWAQSQGYPPPGRMVDIGGRKLHLNCSGTGTPTVVLVAGGGAYSIDWALVQSGVAAATRVCSYDRAGLAWSDPGPADETVEQTVGDLHDILRAGHESGPYVLVGALIGGIYARAFQRRYPEEVAGLVFSNSSNRVGRVVKGGKGGLLWELSEDEIRSGFPMPADAKGAAPTHEGEPFDRLPKPLQATRLWLDVQGWRQWHPEKEGPDSMLSWRAEFLQEFEETDSGKPVLGALPVVVIASSPAADEAARRSRDGAAARLDFLSTNTRHVTATGSGHEIHLYQPSVVAQSLVEMVGAIRDGRRAK